MKSDFNEQEAINNLRRIEIRFHVAKLLTIIAVSILTAIAIIYNVHKDNDRTRDQINCVVSGFLQPPQDVSRAVNGCKK